MARIIVSPDFFSSDADQPHDHRAEDDVDGQLNEEVHSHEAEDHVGSGVFKAKAGGPLPNGGHEEHQAAQQENARVHDGRGDGGDSHGGDLMLGERPVDQAGDQAGQRALEQDGDDRSGDIHDQERVGVAADEDHHAEHKAQPGAGAPAVQRGSYHDGNKGKGEGKDPYMPDCGGNRLQNDDDRRQNGEPGHGTRAHVLFHIQFLSAVAPVQPGAAHLNFSPSGRPCQRLFETGSKTPQGKNCFPLRRNFSFLQSRNVTWS